MTGAPGTDPAALAVVDANLVSHATHLHGDLAGAAVRRVAGTVIADSGLAHDTSNQIGGARPAAGDAPRRGLGTAVSAAAVAQAGALGGAERVVPQASAAGRPVFERLGFRVVGGYVEHPLV